MLTCIQCGKQLNRNDIGFHKKMVNRGAESFCCIDCLCRHFGLTRDRAEKMIARFRQSGCTLFDDEER